MKKVIGVGNALMDILVKLSDDTVLSQLSLPKGSMQLVDENRNISIQKEIQKFEKQFVAGGSAANTIRGIANLGLETGFIGMVGNDEVGRKFEEEMIYSNVKPHMLYNVSNQSGTATTFVSSDSERTFATFLGAAIGLSTASLSETLFKEYDYLHIEGYLVQNHDLIREAVKMAKLSGLKVSLDLASYNVVEDNLPFLHEIVREHVDIVFANEEEAKAFTGLEPEQALHKIAEMSETAIVKVGKKGSMIKKGNDIITIGTIEANALDTTGAGDLYAAGFLYGLANNYSLEKSGNIGKILSGNIIEVMGVKMEQARWDAIKTEIAKL